jgi:2-polyprenyl-6-methoxyphenol hydroxylase-like FAD-dependent oxidoreductase
MPQPRPNPIDMAEDIIWFPRAYEDAWGGPELARPEIERARNFLSRMAIPAVEAGSHCYAAGDRVLDGKAAAATLRAIINNETNRTVPIIAWLIQTRIYNSRHASFVPDPLIQAVRFMLIKANVPGNAACKRTRSVLDFFFDPTLHRNSDIVPPGIEWVRYHYPAGRLRVCIIGGGPTGLASAISLAEKGRGRVEIHVWERRWIVTETGMIDYPPDARRRDQVVTLQDTVTSLLSPRTFEALFEGRPERVWPGSANIQIRKVEDRLLSRCQTDEFHGLIYLHAEGVTRDELAAGKCGDFHILLGTDGAGSWVRQSYFRGYENERGRSYALGLAFDRGPKAGLPWSQPLNMFLTLGQTRYLLNASDYDGRGYLNMQLTEEEWHKMVGLDGQPIHFGSPGCLRRADGSLPSGFEPGRVFAPSEDRGSPLWRSIEDGLKLFGFKEDEVINVVRIPIVVQAVREGVQILPPEDSRGISRPHALVALAGDAAMTVHFWPGRGLNSGIKAGIALGDEICHALHGGRFAGLPLTAMQQYNDFIIKLQGREHDKRSIPILNQSGTPELLSWLLEQAPAVPEEVAVEW